MGKSKKKRHDKVQEVPEQIKPSEPEEKKLEKPEQIKPVEPEEDDTPVEVRIREAVAAGNLFGEEEKKQEKLFCPNCGTELIGQNHFCMCCGMNVTPKKSESVAEEDDTPFGGTEQIRVTGSGYGGGNAYVEREKKLRRKTDARIERNSFFNGFVMKTVAVVLGFVIGLLVLQWSFGPKDSVTVYTREIKVEEFAQIKDFGIPQNTDFELPTDKDKSKKNDKETAEKVQKAPKGNLNFKGTLTVSAHGDRIYLMEEEEVWDTKGWDSYDIAHVINRLNYLYLEYFNQIFIECDIRQEENRVVLHLVYNSLDLKENVETLQRLGVIEWDLKEEIGSKTYISLMKAAAFFEENGWVKMLAAADGASQGDQNAK